MGGFALDMTAKLSSSQWPEIIRIAVGRSGRSCTICTKLASRLENIARQSGIQGQGPPPWLMK